MQKNQHATCETAGQSVCHLIFNVLNLFLWGRKTLPLCLSKVDWCVHGSFTLHRDNTGSSGLSSTKNGDICIYSTNKKPPVFLLYLFTGKVKEE